MAHTARWLGGRGFAVAATVMAALLAPCPASSQVRNQWQIIPAGYVSWIPNDAAPIDGTGSKSQLEFDQRKMAFGQVAISAIILEATGAGGSSIRCGMLTLKVARYQSYWLTWSLVDDNNALQAPETVILYRGGLVADANRPYVGVFFGAGNRLEIRTYDRAVAYDQYGSPVPGKIFNAWTAASVTAPTNRISPEKNGLWAVAANGAKSPWRTGASRC